MWGKQIILSMLYDVNTYFVSRQKRNFMLQFYLINRVLRQLSHIFLNFCLVVAVDDYVMIAVGTGEEIVDATVNCHLDLGATKVALFKVSKYSSCGDEVVLQVSAQLEYGDFFLFEVALDRNAYARLKVGVKIVFVHHIKGQGAVGENHFATLNIYSARVGLESPLTSYFVENMHADHSGDIPFTRCHNALFVEECK